MRIAHYVASTHWDREWYEPFQGYRMRLVSLLDEVFDTMRRDPEFKAFVIDGQYIPIADYLEARPEAEQVVKEFVRSGRLKLGPWYVLPDEWLPCGESLIRNLQMGMEYSAAMGGPASHAGAACDQFGHTSQLPQIFSQLGVKVAFVWRGTDEKTHSGHSIWTAPDGSSVIVYRYGLGGYCHFAFDVRQARLPDESLKLDAALQRLIDFIHLESKRTPQGPLLLFDGADHLEIEPAMSKLIALANERLATEQIHIVHSDLDQYAGELLDSGIKIDKTLQGELRVTADQSQTIEQPWMIPGVLSSRIHLKQKNAACEDELCLWAEPFATFASTIGLEYPSRYLELSWKHLLDNHPHDSLCGCSIDPVHQDMIYRFDQSIGISSRLTDRALRMIASAALPPALAENTLPIAVFNATAELVDEPIDIDIPLPTNWPTKFQEYFQYEEKFSFRLTGPDGKEIPYQLVGQQRDQAGYRRPRYKFPATDRRHIVHVTARVQVPAFGYTTLLVSPVDGPTRFSGSLATSHRSIENEHLKVLVNANGTIDLTDKRSNRTFSGLLAFEQRADIGDGWFHGLAVNDQIDSSIGSPAEVSLIADGIGKATMRIAVSMRVPEEFDFRLMQRSERRATLPIVTDVTLRDGADHLEMETTVENTVRDHRLRALFPTDLPGETYFSDAAFDVVERAIAMRPGHDQRREWEVETRPQITWTAFAGDGDGLAVVSRGLPECTVRDTADRAIALTLLRAFRRAVFSNDNPGGQIQGTHTFRYRLVPFSGPVPTRRLFILGQRVDGTVRSIDLLHDRPTVHATLPPIGSFFEITGDVVVTSLQRDGQRMLVRIFNPHTSSKTVRFPKCGRAAWTVCHLDGQADDLMADKVGDRLTIPAKRILTLMMEFQDVAGKAPTGS